MKSILIAVPAAYRALFASAALTGARLGEVLALQWKHIDLKNGTVRIEQSLWQGQLLPPKAAGGNRTAPFGGGLSTALAAHQRNSIHVHPENFVFCKRDGTPLNTDVLRKDVPYPTLDRLNLPGRTGASGFHSFRHSAASFVNAQTGNLKLAQKLLGPSTIGMTADVYTHTSAEEERQAAIAVEQAICGDLFLTLFESANNLDGAAVN